MGCWSFTEHPSSVGESYGRHLGSAWGFAGRMIGGGMACLVHGLLPFLFVTAGSATVRRLHDRMVVARMRTQPDAGRADPGRADSARADSGRADSGPEQPRSQATEGRP